MCSSKLYASTKIALHGIAGTLLILVAVGKIAANLRGYPSSGLQNPAFPFLTNATVYSFTAVAEVFLAFLCFAHIGKNRASYPLLIFIGLALWYRGTVHLTGSASSCNCLGVFGSIFRLTPGQESAAAWTILSILALSALPTLIDHAHKLRVRYVTQGLTLVLMCASVIPCPGEILQIQGRYSYQRFNAESGAAFTNSVGGLPQWGSFHFSALLSRSPEYQIHVRSADDPALWTEIRYDGTNFITIQPNRPPFRVQSTDSTSESFVTISRSPHFQTAASDWAYAAVPWVTYGINPGALGVSPEGVVDIPLPWETSRRKPEAHGWRWNIRASECGRFPAFFEVRRDTTLDLGNPRAEFLRPELHYPDNVNTRNRYVQSLDYRAQITNRFLNASFQTTRWLTTNGLAVPISAELTTYLLYGKHPIFRATLNVDQVSSHVLESAPHSVAPSSSTVYDYRYRAQKGARLFEHAEYLLPEGASWRPFDDPELLAMAERHLTHGPKLPFYGISAKHISAWVLGAVLFVGVPVLMRIQKNKEKHTTERAQQ